LTSVGESDVYDTFNNTDFDGAFDTSKWAYVASLAETSMARQSNGFLSIADDSPQDFGATVLKATGFEYVYTDTATIQADLAICSETAPGYIGIALRSTNLPDDSLAVMGCDVEYVDYEYTVGCQDMLWKDNAAQYSYTTQRFPVTPEDFTRVSIAVDTSTLTITYTIGGWRSESHATLITDPQIIAALKNETYFVAISTWKTTASSPLVGLIDNVIIQKNP
jgi:hypothetical protein